MINLPCINCVTLPICKNQCHKDGYFSYIRKLLGKCSLIREFIIEAEDDSLYQKVNVGRYVTLLKFLGFKSDLSENSDKSWFVLRSW